MANRSLLVGTATVEVDMWRYDELLHKEEKLTIIENLLKNTITPIEIFSVIMGGVEVEHE